MSDIARTRQQLRHLPFIEAISASKEADPLAAAARAGLLALRLVDAWMEDGALVIGPDARAARSARAAIEAIPAGSLTRGILLSVLDAMAESAPRDTRVLGPRLMAYGRTLDLDAQWNLAVDVYDTIVEHVIIDEDCETYVTALLRRASCLRDLGRLGDAEANYDLATKQATSYNDVGGSLRAQIGRAKLAIARGNLPSAASILAETIQTAETFSLTEIGALATHDLSTVAFIRGDYHTAIRYAYAALRATVDPSQRDRLLSDVAASFVMLGAASAARDVYLLLAATAREQYPRWASTINLMAIAAADGSRVQFERYQRELAGADLRPLLRAEFELHVGRGYHLLGENDSAREWLERAIDTAGEHSLNRIVFEAEAALAANVVRARTLTHVPILGIEIERIADELRALRELTVPVGN